jgi:D-alanine-D-alanine ligase
VRFQCDTGTQVKTGMQAYLECGNPQTSCDYYQAALTLQQRDFLSVLKPYGIKVLFIFK